MQRARGASAREHRRDLRRPRADETTSSPTYDLVVEATATSDEPEVAEPGRASAVPARRRALRTARTASTRRSSSTTVLDRYGGDERRRERAARARALLNRGTAERGPSPARRRRATGRSSGSPPEYLDDATESRLSLELRARVNEAICLGRLGRNREALAIYEEVLDEPIDLDDEAPVEDVLRAVCLLRPHDRQHGTPRRGSRLPPCD